MSDPRVNPATGVITVDIPSLSLHEERRAPAVLTASEPPVRSPEELRELLAEQKGSLASDAPTAPGSERPPPPTFRAAAAAVHQAIERLDAAASYQDDAIIDAGADFLRRSLGLAYVVLIEMADSLDDPGNPEDLVRPRRD